MVLITKGIIIETDHHLPVDARKKTVNIKIIKLLIV